MDPSEEDRVGFAGSPKTHGAEVSEEDARMALAAYESASEAMRESKQARRQALDTLEAWLRKRGLDQATLPGPDRERSVELVQKTRRSVDYEKLNSALDPETRAEIVTERVWEFVRVV